MNIPKAGSKWCGGEEVFHVMSTVEIEGKIWVYYHKDKPKTTDPEDYSCYLESFLHRFRELLE